MTGTRDGARQRLVLLALAVTVGWTGLPRGALAQDGCGASSGRTRTGLYYECTGRGADVVILIHAFSMDRRMWAAQVELLRRSRRVITYDLRAHGRSAAATEPYSAVADLDVLMDELDVRKAHLIGLSNGARLALDFALTRPERVRSLVLAAPGVSGYVSREPMPWLEPVLGAARTGDVERASELWAATPLMQVDDRAAAEQVRQISRDNRALWSYSANPELPLSPPALGRLPEISVPVLVVTGERDLPELRRLADTVARQISGASLYVLARAGHLVNLAAPDEFNAAVAAFLNELPHAR